MLFHSYPFLFLFLPVVLAVFYRLRPYRHGIRPTLWLLAASLVFYAYWRSAYLLLLIGSVVLNYGAGSLIAVLTRNRSPRARWLLTLTIALDLGILGYFKYTDFLIDSVNALAGTDWPLQHIVLPLAVSFFTFNQIAYLVDVYKGYVHEYGFLNYCLFIVFFPHLIAGPIVHHRDIIPQFKHFNFSLNSDAVALGLTIFSVGLFKKVVFADGVAGYANAVFGAAAGADAVPFAEAWLGVLAYTLQLYFDFSGYSDMAVGSALLFGIRFPWNFDAPYQATSMIDFWRRWHISLSEFLRDYLYIPLGGSRRGRLRKSGNILIAMLLGGLWHGAAWTFVLWGGLHGLYLVINHAWRDFRGRFDPPRATLAALERSFGQALTFLAVVAGWVLFRSDSLDTAGKLYGGMLGLNGLPVLCSSPKDLFPHLAADASVVEPLAWVAGLLAICWLTPSLRQQVESHQRGKPRRIWAPAWRPSRAWAVYSGILAWLAVMFLSRPTEFLYYQF